MADVSRNVVFESQEPNVVERRGHIMFMHDGDVQVEAAGFYGLGRTDKRRPIDDPVVVADTDNPGKKTTDVLMANPNPDLMGKTVTLSDGTVIINGMIYANGQAVENVSHRVLAQIPDPGHRQDAAGACPNRPEPARPLCRPFPPLHLRLHGGRGLCG